MEKNVAEKEALHLMIVANRLPYELKWNDKTKVTEVTISVSGLVTVLQTVLDGNNDVLWLGGMSDERFLENEKLLRSKNDKIRCVPIPENASHLHKIWSNDKLWPLFHDNVEVAHQVSDKLPRNAWEGYKEVNEKFAEKALEHSVESMEMEQGRQHLIWIHDFHLFLVPGLLKKKLTAIGRNCPIGFYLHIPFPSLANFEKIPNFEELLEGILGSSMIAFQTKEFRLNFIRCCKKHVDDCEVDDTNMEILYKESVVIVRIIPAGISYEKMSGYSMGEFSETCPGGIKELGETSSNKTIIVGVDRIDYAKGLHQKVRAFQSLLHQFPEFGGNVLYVQIAVPCRQENLSFKDMQGQMETLVHETNAQLSGAGYSSRILLIVDKVSQQDLAVLYKRANVAFVTPLRDGMNLVAMEYVACQPAIRSLGVLILSKFAGAADTMHEALKVDPNDAQAMIDALKAAITMKPKQRQMRMVALKKSVRNQSAQCYVEENIRSMKNSSDIRKSRL